MICGTDFHQPSTGTCELSDQRANQLYRSQWGLHTQLHNANTNVCHSTSLKLAFKYVFSHQ